MKFGFVVGLVLALALVMPTISRAQGEEPVAVPGTADVSTPVGPQGPQPQKLDPATQAAYLAETKKLSNDTVQKIANMADSFGERLMLSRLGLVPPVNGQQEVWEIGTYGVDAPSPAYQAAIRAEIAKYSHMPVVFVRDKGLVQAIPAAE